MFLHSHFYCYVTSWGVFGSRNQFDARYYYYYYYYYYYCYYYYY